MLHVRCHSLRNLASASWQPVPVTATHLRISQRLQLFMCIQVPHEKLVHQATAVMEDSAEKLLSTKKCLRVSSQRLSRSSAPSVAANARFTLLPRKKVFATAPSGATCNQCGLAHHNHVKKGSAGEKQVAPTAMTQSPVTTPMQTNQWLAETQCGISARASHQDSPAPRTSCARGHI
jgi:hypothetical protein